MLRKCIFDFFDSNFKTIHFINTMLQGKTITKEQIIVRTRSLPYLLKIHGRPRLQVSVLVSPNNIVLDRTRLFTVSGYPCSTISMWWGPILSLMLVHLALTYCCNDVTHKDHSHHWWLINIISIHTFYEMQAIILQSHLQPKRLYAKYKWACPKSKLRLYFHIRKPNWLYYIDQTSAP